MALPIHLPPELSAAKQTMGAALRAAFPTTKARLDQVFLYCALLAIGSWGGLGIVELGVVSAGEKDFWRAALTAISVLSGFMITTMIFTGRIDVAKSLSLSELRDVAEKSNYLLLYQMGTLANHLVCLCVMLLVPQMAKRWPLLELSVAVLALGLFFVSIARSLLVPVQIIELHRFTHAALLREKRDEAGFQDV